MGMRREVYAGLCFDLPRLHSSFLIWFQRQSRRLAQQQKEQSFTE